MKPIVLKGERVVLRPLRLSDAKVLVKYVNDAELTKYLNLEPPLSLKQEQDYVKRTVKGWKEEKEFVWAITLDGRLIGTIGFHDVDKKNLSAELGLWIAREHQSKGIGYESAQLAINCAFEKFGLNRIDYYMFTPNVASKKLAEKFGKYEGTLREDRRKNGVFYDSHVYGILKREWKK
jgi:ribosomal-protein-alanine N-acetyltransferase